MVCGLCLSVIVKGKNMNKRLEMFWDPRIKKEHE